mmetsp:Transcript_56003/g.121918  ORF Transcript_56003/g.121918 Transcript_56003/m.121918 type:complete len:290 (+) Transcript_56003:206-1075(+)
MRLLLTWLLIHVPAAFALGLSRRAQCPRWQYYPSLRSARQLPNHVVAPCHVPNRMHPISLRTGSASSTREQLLAELQKLLFLPTPPPVKSAETQRSQRLDEVLDELKALNPTANPGSAEGFAPFACGVWRVAFAPHIAKMSEIGSVTFDPILYDLRADGTIISHVQYCFRSPVVNEQGWLSTSGRYGSRDEAVTSFVEWSDAWWNPRSELPTTTSDGAAFKSIVTALGRAGFINGFANFPVEYLDDDLCVFVFPLSATRIAAVREGGLLDVWRQGDHFGNEPFKDQHTV